MQPKMSLVIRSATPPISRAPTPAIVPLTRTSEAQVIIVAVPPASARSIVLVIDTADPGILPAARIVACDGSVRFWNVISKLKVPLIMPTPALTVHLKRSSSMISKLWSPGAHWVTWFGSVRNA